jgi:ATP-dependent exoDNAse (exonuclease V) alpha subunit
LAALAEGAVELPLSHLSARVAWHDTDWTGRVCQAPAANNSCSILKNVKGKKNADVEEEDAGSLWADLAADRVPPCVFERAGFMRPTAFSIVRDHAYSGGWTPSHEHFAPTLHRMPAYSIEATPYRWVMRDEAKLRAAEWDIAFRQDLEERADSFIKKKKATTWVQDHRNQLALLDSFFSSLRAGTSLVFLYAKDVPLLEERPPGARVLLGAGFVSEVAPHREWEYTGDGPLRSIIWERAVSHTIRPNFGNGFLLPYHALLANPAIQGDDLLPFVAYSPNDHFDEFSYVSERVGNDAAIAALLELARVVDLLPGVADGPWQTVAAWISNRIADTWKLRGPYPGLGSALTAAGLERGGLIAHRITQQLDDPSQDPWPALEAGIAEAAASDSGPLAGLVGRMARQAWALVQRDPDQLSLLHLLARFPLTAAQARRVLDAEERAVDHPGVTDSQLLENPYLLFELDRGRRDAIGLSMVDRGLFPQEATARAALDAAGLPDPVREASDDRRVRAACTELLEQAAANEGHALLDEPRLRRRLVDLKLEPVCDPTSALFEIAANGFDRVLCETPLAGGRGRGWQLARLAAAADLISEAVGDRLDAESFDADWNWRQLIDDAIPEPPNSSDPEEELARTEKADALRTLARARIAALIGPAGTGKTTMLKALCSHPDIGHRGILLVAPTGKARVQLGDKVGARALTLAQHLRPTGRWHEEFGYRLRPDAKRDGQYATVIVDEASMLTEEMLAALLDSVTNVDRLILCGDHRQLPPIGAGRPFADIIAHLRSITDESSEPKAEATGGAIAELTIGRRQRHNASETITGRDDLAIASLFSIDGSAPAADEALGRVIAGKGDGTIEIISWDDEDDLHRKVVAFLASDPELAIPVGDADALKRSLGANETYKDRASFGNGAGGSGAEHWQMLTPVRARPGGVAGLNSLVRRTWRKGDATAALRSYRLPPPLGGDEILFHDKVMCAVNHHRGGWDPIARTEEKGDVANGEIGMAVAWMKNDCIKVEFSTQAHLRYTFWTNELNSERERASELLELAYAITVHKAQGSQFEITLVVAPNPCALLSPELLYTALTRQRNRVILFAQGDPSDLRKFGSPTRSETARRLTRLFRAPDPFETPDGTVVDGAHVHRTGNDEMVRSKSEVIVANVLKNLEIAYAYEQDLIMPDGSWRSPDFTITRAGKPPVYWEHLGMLDKAGYRADWEAKRNWYGSHSIHPWTDGGGPNGTLVWSTEGQTSKGIDTVEIELIARDVFGLPAANTS